MLIDGKRMWVEYETLASNPDDFGAVGTAFDKEFNIEVHTIQNAEVRFFNQRLLVNFATQWMEQNRDFTV